MPPFYYLMLLSFIHVINSPVIFQSPTGSDNHFIKLIYDATIQEIFGESREL